MDELLELLLLLVDFELRLLELLELTAGFDCLDELLELTEFEVDLDFGALVDERYARGLVCLDAEDFIVLLLSTAVGFGDMAVLFLLEELVLTRAGASDV